MMLSQARPDIEAAIEDLEAKASWFASNLSTVASTPVGGGDQAHEAASSTFLSIHSSRIARRPAGRSYSTPRHQWSGRMNKDTRR